MGAEESKELPYWISWYARPQDGAFELNAPWWISGSRLDDGADTICAAVLAGNEEDAKEIVRQAYDTPPDGLEFRFASVQDPAWEPFNDRFGRAEWMPWPPLARLGARD